MRRRLLFYAIVFGFLIMTVLSLNIWSSDTNLSLKIVRQTVENANQVVFFRVVGAGNRRIQICGVQRIAGDNVDLPFELHGRSSRPFRFSSNFWAASQSWPMGDYTIAKKEFGVQAPTDTPVWKVRATVSLAISPSWEWCKMMLKHWKSQRSSGCSMLKATQGTWTTFYQVGGEELESDYITNTIFLK
jgi:hypothetical protein